MCGIAGILDRNAALDGREIDRRVGAMVATLHHRGPDDGGRWSDPPAGIGIGMRRLAVIDTSPAGHQPMTSSCGRYVMVYNGEVYNHRDLASKLAVQGRHVQGGSDTAVLLEACAAWGIEAAIERAVGMFAFALYDRRDRALMLVRDRLGIKPLYWAREGEVLILTTFCLSILLVYSVATPNVGTRYRIRYAYLMPFVALGILAMGSLWREIREARDVARVHQLDETLNT